MGYSDSQVTVERRKGWLSTLMDGEPTSWSCKIGEEQDIAYQVRECFHVAKKNPGIFPGLERAASTFVVEVAPGLVTAREKIMSAPTVVPVGSPEGKIEAVSNPTKHLAGEVSKIGRKSVPQIVSDWIGMGSRGILHCPQAGLSREELLKLHSWAQNERVLVFWNDPMVTVREYDDALAPHAFTPEDLNAA